jgi:hypothetical protein
MRVRRINLIEIGPALLDGWELIDYVIVDRRTFAVVMKRDDTAEVINA